MLLFTRFCLCVSDIWLDILIDITITRYIDTTQNWTLIMEQRRMIRFLRIMLNNSLNYIHTYLKERIFSMGKMVQKVIWTSWSQQSRVPHTCTLCICSKIMLGANPLYQLSHAWQATIIISSPCSLFCCCFL